jgi:hypothetical protein
VRAFRRTFDEAAPTADSASGGFSRQIPPLPVTPAVGQPLAKHMMKIKEINPSECFSGLDRDGWLDYPNLFHCPKCDYGVYFNRQSLEKGFINHQNKPLKLNLLVALFFTRRIQRFISSNSERFILDFYCPKCQSPYVIGFESADFHKDDYHYRPIVIFNVSWHFKATHYL